MHKMLEEINRDRFWAALAWLDTQCEWLVPMINWDMIGVSYISVGLFLIIIAWGTHEEVSKDQTSLEKDQTSLEPRSSCQLCRVSREETRCVR